MDPAFALVLVSLAAGYLARRLGAFPEAEASALNRFVIWVCLPALILRLVPELSLGPGLAILVLTPWVVLGVSVVLVHAAARALHFRREVLGALLLCVPLGNTSFLGFPMVRALLGEDAVRYAVLYDQLGSFLILATYGSFVVPRYASDEKPTLRTVALKVLAFPPFVALLVALVPFERPPLLALVLRPLGEALVPVAMFAVGLKMRLRPPRGDALPLLFGLTAKMAIAPLVALFLGRALVAPQLAVKVAVLEAGMPPMITAGALAMMAGLAPELAAALVGYGILLSFVTLPMLARLL